MRNSRRIDMGYVLMILSALSELCELMIFVLVNSVSIHCQVGRWEPVLVRLLFECNGLHFSFIWKKGFGMEIDKIDGMD